MLNKPLAMIDTESCSSYHWGTLVEISAGFDGSEGGVKEPSWYKDYWLDVFIEARTLLSPQDAEMNINKISLWFSIHDSRWQMYY